MALAACASAQQYAYESYEESELWQFNGDAEASAANLDLLEARVAAIEGNQGMVVSGVQLAQSSMVRVDGIVDEVSTISGEIAAAVSELESTHSTLVSESDVASMTYTINKVLGDAVRDDEKAGKEAKAGVKASVDNLKASADALEKAVAEKIAGMEAIIDDSVKAVQKNGAFYGSDAHIKQVCGFDPIEDIEKYWDGKVYTSTADNGEVRGRKFYKVKFNINQRGYFTSGSDELFFACSALSKYLRSVDGISRDLRPPCNHQWHNRVGGLGQCIFIWRSYFSHCGGGGYWRQNEACAGVPEVALRMTVNYEMAQHNWDRHLAHNSRENSHDWVSPYRTSSHEYVMCTSGNQNYKV